MCLVGKVSLCVSTWDSSLSLRDLYCRSVHLIQNLNAVAWKRKAKRHFALRPIALFKGSHKRKHVNLFDLSRYSLECLFLWHLSSEATKLVSLACLNDSGGSGSWRLFGAAEGQTKKHSPFAASSIKRSQGVVHSPWGGCLPVLPPPWPLMKLSWFFEDWLLWDVPESFDSKGILMFWFVLNLD